jgi:outer membrane beta-barrel protein
MNSKRFAAVIAVALVTSGAAALAQTRPEQDLIESVAVRNRLYKPQGRWEIGPSVGFTVLTRLTNHYVFNLGAAYNFDDTLAGEIRGGYAYSSQTGLARQVGEELLKRDPVDEVTKTHDFSNLWEMKANGVVGVRWAPVYGKISLMAEVPVHFQTYLSAGIGAGTFHRQSLVMCFRVLSRAGGQCGSFYQEDKVAPMASAAIGFRFFTHPGGAIKLEVRDWTFPDSYRMNINRLDAETTGTPNGEAASSPGLTNLVVFDLGYSFLF